MNKLLTCLLLSAMLANNSCNEPEKNTDIKKDVFTSAPGTFGYDYQFLQKYDSIILLKSDDPDAQVVVSPKYQGKVFTSTANGDQGFSFGWVNYKAFSDSVNQHMNAYGGENRLWLGPEGGIFSLFFKPKAEMVYENWKTPPSVDTESWTVISKTQTRVMMRKEMHLTNYQGTALNLAIDRSVRILSRQTITNDLKIDSDIQVKVVAYETTNTITNTGDFEWTEKTGMPCIWLLDMLKPSPSAVIVVPFLETPVDSFSHVATTNYFGEIPPDRLKHINNTLFFKADGKSRGKLGIHPEKAKPVAGSYDSTNKALTIILFDLSSNARYLNQEWNTTKPPFSGDAVNAYNDGPLADGKQMGPFYEIESVSPAAFLKPEQSLTHHHTVIHFTGEEKVLDKIAQKFLGVSLETIKQQF
ncbi:MAG TPA: DUF6786 family protein [Puia sp.]|nr:DUF6786 family protein [Puia sp.]